MWKKSKRILLCILALMLLLSMAKSEQLFVQADMESTEKVQTKDVKNRSQRQEENSDEKGQEESTDKKEEASTKATQKTEETLRLPSYPRRWVSREPKNVMYNLQKV